jgi:hypothetical protein
MSDLWGQEARARARRENADRKDSADERPVAQGSSAEVAARLSAPVSGRCLHGFVIGSGLCSVRDCEAHGSGKARTCITCRKRYTGQRSGTGRRCPDCAKGDK